MLESSRINSCRCSKGAGLLPIRIKFRSFVSKGAPALFQYLGISLYAGLLPIGHFFCKGRGGYFPHDPTQRVINLLHLPTNSGIFKRVGVPTDLDAFPQILPRKTQSIRGVKVPDGVWYFRGLNMCVLFLGGPRPLFACLEGLNGNRKQTTVLGVPKTGTHTHTCVHLPRFSSPISPLVFQAKPNGRQRRLVGQVFA